MAPSIAFRYENSLTLRFLAPNVRRMEETAIEKAIRIVGGVTRLAEATGVRPPSIYKWHRQIPAERVLDVERATGGAVTRHELRPDLYPLEAV